MSEDTPHDIQVRESFVYAQLVARGKNPATFDSKFGAAFDRWLAAHDAEIRADAWDEGFDDGIQSGYNALKRNPYRTPRPPAPELIPGVQAAVDALSIYRKG